MKRHIPNIITSVRLIAALALLCLTTRGDTATRYFLFLFIAAGVSDMLDGHLARRLDCCTEFGAKLDSISDLALYVASTLFLIRFAWLDVQRWLPLVIIGAALQALHLVLSFWRHKQFPAYHSTFSRLAAYMIFFAVVAFWHFHLQYAIPLIAVLWTACSIEGMIISVILRRPECNISSIRKAIAVTVGQREVQARS